MLQTLQLVKNCTAVLLNTWLSLAGLSIKTQTNYTCAFFPDKPFSAHFISAHGAARFVRPFHSLRVDSHILSDTECNTHTI